MHFTADIEHGAFVHISNVVIWLVKRSITYFTPVNKTKIMSATFESLITEELDFRRPCSSHNKPHSNYWKHINSPASVLPSLSHEPYKEGQRSLP